MSDKKRFLKSGIMLTLVGLAIRTVGMFFGAFISRAVGAEGTGLYTLIMTVYSFAVTFATSGISLTVTRLVAAAIGEGREEKLGSILRSAILWALGFGVAATGGLFLGAEFLGGRILSDIRTVTSLKILAFSLIPSSLIAVFSGYFVGVKRVSFNAAVSVFCQGAKIVLTVILVSYLAPRGTVSAVGGLCLGITLTELFGFLLIFIEFLYDRHNHRIAAVKGNSQLSSVAGMALPLALSAYVRSLLLNIEHILIPKKLRERGENTTEAYSHYGTLHGMALPLVTYPMSPLSSFAGLLVPEFAEDMSAGRAKRMSRIATKAINTTLSYATICAVFLFSFSEELGYVVYKSYDAGYYISALSLIVPIMYLDHVTDSMLKGIGEQVFSMWVNITDSLLSVFLVWLLIPQMGIMGYAIVIIVMESYNFILSFLRLRRKIDFKLSPIKSGIIPFLSALIASNISRRLFWLGGSNVPSVWLTLKILFSLAITVSFISTFNVIIEMKNKKYCREKNKTTA